MVERFAKIAKSFKKLIILVKRSILDVWQGSEYAIVSAVSINCAFTRNLFSGTQRQIIMLQYEEWQVLNAVVWLALVIAV